MLQIYNIPNFIKRKCQNIFDCDRKAHVAYSEKQIDFD